MQSKLYNKEGKDVGSISLPEHVFGIRWNPELVHQVVVSMMARRRAPIANTKDRREVSGGGRKPWRQKGTGRARHGSSRSPLWRGGGITFGPSREKNFDKKINKKMRTKALYSALSKKFKNGDILFIDSLGLRNAKTKDARAIIDHLARIEGFHTLLSKKHNAAFVFTPKKDEPTYKSFRNFGNMNVDELRNMNLLHILNYKYLIIVDPEEGMKYFMKS